MYCQIWCRPPRDCNCLILGSSIYEANLANAGGGTKAGIPNTIVAHQNGLWLPDEKARKKLLKQQRWKKSKRTLGRIRT